jgi:hypothetical protein
MSNDVVATLPRAYERAQQQAADPAITDKNDCHPDGKRIDRKVVYPVGHIIFLLWTHVHSRTGSTHCTAKPGTPARVPQGMNA